MPRTPIVQPLIFVRFRGRPNLEIPKTENGQTAGVICNVSTRFVALQSNVGPRGVRTFGGREPHIKVWQLEYDDICFIPWEWLIHVHARELQL